MFHLTVIGNNNVMHDITVTADIIGKIEQLYYRYGIKPDSNTSPFNNNNNNIGETDAFDISGNNNYVHDVEVTNGDEW